MASYLNIHTRCLNSSFSLEYLYQGDLEKFKQLSPDAVEICSIIEKEEQLRNSDIVSYSDLEVWEFMRVLKTFFDSEKLKSITEEAKEIKNKLINNPLTIEEKEIRKMQSFFNTVGDPFLHLAMRQCRRN